MWQLLHYKYAEEFVTFWLTDFFHNWPHVSYVGFESYSSTFDPTDAKYVQTLIFWGAIPVLWLIASLLLIIVYGICKCCKNRRRQAHQMPNRQQRTKCLKWMIIMLALFSAAFVGGGFYGNETTASGVQHLLKSAESANDTIATAEEEISTVYSGITVDLAGEVNQLKKIFSVPVGNASLENQLREEMRALQGMLGDAGENISEIKKMYSNNLDLSGSIATVQYYETVRWLGFIGVFCFQLVICLMVLCGACTRSKCSLVSSAILCVTGMVIVWCLAGAEMFVTMGLSDFCADPNTFIMKEAKMNTDLTDDFLNYYIHCGQTTSPFSKDLSTANRNLALAGSTLDSIAALARGYYPEAEPKIAEAKTTLDSVSSSFIALSANLQCTSSGIHKDYITSLYSVCYDSVLGVTVMMLSAVLTGLLFTAIIVFTINLNGRLPKRKFPYAVDQEDPFLPPNDNTATLERYRRNVEPARVRENPPAPLPSDPRARPISLSSSLQGYSHEPGTSGSNRHWPASQQRGANSGWGPATATATATAAAATPSASSSQPPPNSREGYDSPPPSYTLAMSRDNQRRNQDNRPNRQQSRLSSGSIV